jgi:hypothetical protein
LLHFVAIFCIRFSGEKKTIQSKTSELHIACKQGDQIFGRIFAQMVIVGFFGQFSKLTEM